MRATSQLMKSVACVANQHSRSRLGVNELLTLIALAIRVSLRLTRNGIRAVFARSRFRPAALMLIGNTGGRLHELT